MQNPQLNTSTHSDKLVSFILTYYNQPTEMLTECIDSILRLSLSEKEREIILIDDGSYNSPINEISQYWNDITYIRKKNEGVSVARNIGLTICIGKYIQFVDTDDFLIPSAYEHCIDLIRYHHPDVVTFCASKNAKGKISTTLPDTVDGAEYLRHNNLKSAVWCYLFKKEILGELKFTKGIAYAEDEEFTPQLLLRAENIMNTDAEAYYYRNNPNSVSKDYTKRSKIKRLNDTETVILKLKELSYTLPITDKTAIERRTAQLTMDYIYNSIILTKSSQNVERRISRLKKNELFPLPVHDYTKKYKWFCKFVNHKLSRTILIKTILNI